MSETASGDIRGLLLKALELGDPPASDAIVGDWSALTETLRAELHGVEDARLAEAAAGDGRLALAARWAAVRAGVRKLADLARGLSDAVRPAADAPAHTVASWRAAQAAAAGVVTKLAAADTKLQEMKAEVLFGLADGLDALAKRSKGKAAAAPAERESVEGGRKVDMRFWDALRDSAVEIEMLR